MKNLSCAFFGHSKFDYGPYEDKIRAVVVDLINSGITVFYNGYRGRFDSVCAQIIYELKAQYPQIRNILVLSYMPDETFCKPIIFDEAVFLYEEDAQPRYAVSHTSKELVRTVDYVVSGVVRKVGLAKSICDFAKRQAKSIYNVVTDEQYIWDVDANSKAEAQRVLNEYAEQLKDEQFRKEQEAKLRQTFYAMDVAFVQEIERRKGKVAANPVWITVDTVKNTDN